MTGWLLIPGASLVAAPWPNGLGVSRDIVRRPGWTVSIADLEQDAEFSEYPGADRIFTPIEGDPPPALSFEYGPFVPCPLLVPTPFPGDVPTRSRISTPGRAFNVIVDRRTTRAEVQVLQLEAGDPVPAPDAPHVLLHCLRGRLAAVGELLGPGDSLLGAGPAAPGAAAEEGIALVVAIRPI